jgi:hypothetical protein
MLRGIHVAVLGLCFCYGLAGCQSDYYMVQDPSGNRTFYTDHVSVEDSGSVRFKDLQTGSRVTLQNSVVKRINKSDLPPGLVR